ncbi:mobile mystery protein A [Brevundimonas sp.]|jgi:predicted DNA-binding mobile mystery protein A|uniref:mobile mystery protein A n=1 Tax=Brevundimonas sp. TaxID=1871086 RepID=UPI002E0D8817|nr:mobile mystery protein A [Brevundimonas sp.]
MVHRSALDPRARSQLDKKLAGTDRLREIGMPRYGWIRAIRDGLGMTAQQLANRLGVSRQAVSALEKGEVQATLSLKSLRQAAEALDCTLVYLLVPKSSLEEAVRERAEHAVDAHLARVNKTMGLENQALPPGDLAVERRRLIDEFMRGDPRRLWDDR